MEKVNGRGSRLQEIWQCWLFQSPLCPSVFGDWMLFFLSHEGLFPAAGEVEESFPYLLSLRILHLEIASMSRCCIWGWHVLKSPWRFCCSYPVWTDADPAGSCLCVQLAGLLGLAPCQLWGLLPAGQDHRGWWGNVSPSSRLAHCREREKLKFFLRPKFTAHSVDQRPARLGKGGNTFSVEGPVKSSCRASRYKEEKRMEDFLPSTYHTPLPCLFFFFKYLTQSTSFHC